MAPVFRLVAFACVATLGCNPDLASPNVDCADGAALEETSVLEVTLEPAAPLDRAPPALRLHVRAATLPDPERVLLVEGEVGSGHLGQIARDDISDALAERIVPAITWVAENEVLVAPTRLLAPGTYSLASGEPKASVPVVVTDEHTLLRFVFPPEGGSAGPRLGVWCGAPLPLLSVPIELAPTGEQAHWQSGAIGGSGSGCIHLHSESASPTAAVAPPALVGHDGAMLAVVEPVALHPTTATSWSPRACEPSEIGFGPGCARVFDDRLLLVAPEVPLLWTLQGPGLDVVLTTDRTPALVHPLPPASVFPLAISVLDVSGRVEQRQLSITTQPAMPHVVINEVLANPVGPEPEQEWIELYNDGAATAQLGGYVLADIGGAVTLPAAALAPGAYALIVDEAFDDLATYDPPPAPGTLILRVPEIGQNGLSNEGEPLTLRAAEGHIVSSFPPLPKPKAGRSVMRVHPKAIDQAEGSFVLSPEAPTPGAANVP